MAAAGNDVQGMFSNDIIGTGDAHDGTQPDPFTVRLFLEGIPTNVTDLSRNKKINFSQVFAGQAVGIKEVHDDHLNYANHRKPAGVTQSLCSLCKLLIWKRKTFFGPLARLWHVHLVDMELVLPCLDSPSVPGQNLNQLCQPLFHQEESTMEPSAKEALVKYCCENDRVCPMPSHWKALWAMLPNRKRAGDGWEPVLPPILGAWYDTSALLKSLVLREHIGWAEKHGVLDEVDTFLRSLPESEWAHIGEFPRHASD